MRKSIENIIKSLGIGIATLGLYSIVAAGSAYANGGIHGVKVEAKVITDPCTLTVGKGKKAKHIKKCAKKNATKIVKKALGEAPKTKPLDYSALDKEKCIPNWEYGPWSKCLYADNRAGYTGGYQERTAIDKNKCKNYDISSFPERVKIGCTDYNKKHKGEAGKKGKAHKGKVTDVVVTKKPNEKEIPVNPSEKKISSRFGAYARLGFNYETNITKDGHGNEWVFTGYAPNGQAGLLIDINDKLALGLDINAGGEIFKTDARGGNGNSWALDTDAQLLFNDGETSVLGRAGYSHRQTTYNFKGDEYKTSFDGANVLLNGIVDAFGYAKDFVGLDLPFNLLLNAGSIDSSGKEGQARVNGRVSAGLDVKFKTKAGMFKAGAEGQLNLDYSGYDGEFLTGGSINPYVGWIFKDGALEVNGYIPAGRGDYERYGLGVRGVIAAKKVNIIPELSWIKERRHGTPFSEENNALIFSLSVTPKGLNYKLLPRNQGLSYER